MRSVLDFSLSNMTRLERVNRLRCSTGTSSWGIMVGHIFGGQHTETKLQCLREYLTAFSIALREQEFACIYIDAFAGSGERTEVRPALPLLGSEFSEPDEVTTPGSARLALEVNPPLNTLVLIERDPHRYKALEQLKAEVPERSVILRNGDANELVQRLCQNTQWRGPRTIGRGIRGVIFLDPYGMEVEWKTVAAIGKTKALDCWYFFPLSGLYRNAPKQAPKLSADKRQALNRLFGSDEWYHRWYDHEEAVTDLFGDPVAAARTADVDAIESYVRERLSDAFKGAVLKPIRLQHKNGAPLASLFFAISNTSPTAVKLATKIASHILNRGNSSQVRSR